MGTPRRHLGRATHGAAPRRSARCIVSGTVENQVRFYDRFEHIVLLTVPLDVLLQRVAKRTSNDYGKSLTEREEIARYVETVEPLLRRGAAVELDGRGPVAELADAVERLAWGP